MTLQLFFLLLLPFDAVFLKQLCLLRQIKAWHFPSFKTAIFVRINLENAKVESESFNFSPPPFQVFAFCVLWQMKLSKARLERHIQCLRSLTKKSRKLFTCLKTRKVVNSKKIGSFVLACHPQWSSKYISFHEETQSLVSFQNSQHKNLQNEEFNIVCHKSKSESQILVLIFFAWRVSVMTFSCQYDFL